MKTTFPILFIMLISFASMSQIAPQAGFIDKIAAAEKLHVSNLMKTPLVYNGDNYDLKYHRFDWFVDPDTLFISGSVTSYFTTTQPAVSQISFDFSTHMTVDTVVYHSSKITFSQVTGDVLKIDLPSALPLNNTDSLTVFYHGSPQQGPGYRSFNKSFHNGTPVIWTLSEPFGAKDWWPCKNDLSDKIDSIDIYVITPQQYRSASNGMPVSEVTQNNLTKAHWKHRYPIATYLIAIAVTNYQPFSIYAPNGNDSIQILIYPYPENLADAQTNAKNVINSMELFDSLFITYPFVKERYGMTQTNIGGGMEHQTMTFITDFNFEVMTHELAHHWVGDMITCGSWHDIWLNEGFATYWTGLSYNYLVNGYYWPFWKRETINSVISQPGGSVYCNDTADVNSIFDPRLSYNKGAMILHMLRWTIGDSAFYAGFKSYLTDPNLAYGYAHSSDFIKHMEIASGKDLTEFFNDWLYGAGYPIYSIQCTTSPVNNNIQVTISQTQSDPSVSFFKMPVPLKFKDATHDTIIVFNNLFSGQQYTVNPGFHPDSVLFDPDMWIVSANDTVTLNIPEVTWAGDIAVFPNPTEDFINISYPGHLFRSAEIFNIRGIKVMEINAKNVADAKLKLNVADLAKGIYFLKATFEDNILLRKVTKL